MDTNRTRKESYRLRKIGKYNYSLTIPPKIVDSLGGYENVKDLYLQVENGNLIVSPKKDIPIENPPTSNNISSKSYIAHEDVCLGFDSTYKCCHIGNDDIDLYGTLDECVKAAKSMFNIEFAERDIAALKHYIENFN